MSSSASSTQGPIKCRTLVRGTQRHNRQLAKIAISPTAANRGIQFRVVGEITCLQQLRCYPRNHCVKCFA